MSERERFEAWYSSGSVWPASVERSGDGYKFAGADAAWRVWQAALATERQRIEREVMNVAGLMTAQRKAILSAIRGEQSAPRVTDKPVNPGEADMRSALELIAAPMRPDGTWNRDREACRELAARVLELPT